jgi:hypothetical protein
VFQQRTTGDSGVSIAYFCMLWSPLWFHYDAMTSFMPFVDVMLNALLADSHASTDMVVTGLNGPSSRNPWSNSGRLLQHAISALNNYVEDLHNRIPQHAVYVALQASFRAVSLKPLEMGNNPWSSVQYDQHEVLAFFALIILTLLRHSLEMALTKQQLVALPFHAASRVTRMCVARKFPKTWFIILITLIRDLPNPRPTSASTSLLPKNDNGFRDPTQPESRNESHSMPHNISDSVRIEQLMEDTDSSVGSSDLIEDALIPMIAGFDWEDMLEIEMDHPAWTILALAGSIPAPASVYSAENSNSTVSDLDWDLDMASLQLKKAVRRLDPGTWRGGLASLQERKCCIP